MSGYQYTDKESKSTTTNAGYSNNGHAAVDTAEEYTFNEWNGGKDASGSNVEYVQFGFHYDTYYTLGPYKVKNIKVTSTGNYSNLSKTITAKASDEKGISSLKWLKGDQTEEAFETEGTEFKDSFDVEEDGIYTVCATDPSGNKTIEKITISGIVKE